MTGGHPTLGQRLRVWRTRRLSTRGFTIIEVMIVLVVMSVLFIAAVVLISGRQNQTAFDQAVRQAQAQIQQTINDVAVGYLPKIGTFNCTSGASGPVLSTGSNGQGINSGCTYIGKAMQFKISGTNPEQFATYIIAGLQNGGAGGAASSSLAEAKPAIIAKGQTHKNNNYPVVMTFDTLKNNLTTSRMWYNNGGADVEIGAVAFVMSQAQYSNGTIVSGTGQVNVVPIANSTLAALSADTVEAMNADGGNGIVTSPANPSGGVFICFSSGSTNQYGIVKIGGSDRDLSVTLTIKQKNNTTCS